MLLYGYINSPIALFKNISQKLYFINTCHFVTCISVYLTLSLHWTICINSNEIIVNADSVLFSQTKGLIEVTKL